MRRRGFARVAAAWVAVVLAAGAAFGAVPCAFAEPATSDAAAGAAAGSAGTDIPQITDRYSSINDLTTSQNSEQGVIVDTTVSVLTSANRALSGMTVRFTGEAVGDVLNADEGFKWVNVLGASGASVGVYMTSEQAKAVVNLGDYHTTGTTLEVTGTYSIACGAHQGELDVHATSVRALDTGGKITRYAQARRLYVALALCVAGFALLGTFIYLRRKSQAQGLTRRENPRRG